METMSVSAGDAVYSPEVDEDPTTQPIYLSADPEQIEVLNNIYLQLQLNTEAVEAQTLAVENQSTLITEGFTATCAFIGFIAGLLLILGLWMGGRK